VADPNLADIQLTEKECVDLLEETRKFGSVNAKNLVAMGQTIVGDLKGDFSTDVSAGVDRARLALAAILAPDAEARLLYPTLRHLAKLYGWPEVDASLLCARRYRYYADNSLTVQSRVLTYGAVTAGGANSGTGTVYCLKEDERGFAIEACAVETKTFRCTADYGLGSRKGEEAFEVWGTPPSKDGLENLGSGVGRQGLDRAMSAADSQRFIGNPSFSIYTGGTPLTALDSWTVNSGTFANIDIRTGAANVYRNPDGDTSYAAIRFSGNEKLYQYIGAAQKLDKDVPYHVAVAWCRRAGATGNLTLRLGNATVTVTIGSGTNDVWNVLTLALDKKRWPYYFDKQSLALEIEVDTLAVGTVDIDDVQFYPMTKIDGLWWSIVGGATPFLLNDYFTQAVTQADATKGKKQYHIYRAFGYYMPHTAGAATDADP